MAKARKDGSSGSTRSLLVRPDEASDDVLVRAAELRRISASDYVRQVTVSQARKEVDAVASQTIALTPEEQLAFWNALQETAPSTPRRRELGEVMRGES